MFNLERLFIVCYVLLLGMSLEEIYELIGIDIWFFDKMWELINIEKLIKYILFNELIKE